MIRFYFIRHGETEWNVQSRFQGIEDIPLNETGMRQAQECGRGLKQTDIPFDCIVSSPLERAFVTAQTIAGYLGITEIHKDPRLIERNFGKVSGRKREEREQMLASGQDLGMEEEEAVAQRMQQAMEALCDQGFRHIVLVSHGASIRALLGKYAEAGSKPTVEVQRNACLTVLAYNGGKFYLEAFDRTPDSLRYL